MLKQCTHCEEGILLPLSDLVCLYYKGKNLFIHDVPYTECTHCRNREYASLKKSRDLAEQAFEQFGITSINFAEKITHR